jgi:hypothetical protein
MERGKSFPNGGSRHGIAHVRLAAGGTTLIYEVHSDGSAGKLDGMLVIWWNKEASLYPVFVCFNNPSHPCEIRGTARWEGDSFVNDYEQTVKGKKTSWRDSFTFTPTSHALVAAMRTGDGTMQTLISTKATRRWTIVGLALAQTRCDAEPRSRRKISRGMIAQGSWRNAPRF